MPASSHPTEREIIDRIKAAKIRLRFDKVVLWLGRELQSKLAKLIPAGETILFTVTAPIKLPAKTAAALETLVRDTPARRNLRRIIHGNHLRIRRLTNVPTDTPKVLVFVHNHPSDATRILTLAQAHLRREPGDRQNVSKSPKPKT